MSAPSSSVPPSMTDILSDLAITTSIFVKNVQEKNKDSELSNNNENSFDKAYFKLKERLKVRQNSESSIISSKNKSDGSNVKNIIKIDDASKYISKVVVEDVNNIKVIPDKMLEMKSSPPFFLIEKMENLLENMGAPVVKQAENISWSRLDFLSSSIRSAWVKTLSERQSSSSDISQWLDSWSEIIAFIQHNSPSWDKNHSVNWKFWADERQKEVSVLRQWIPPLSIKSLFDVPQSFKNSGLVPVASSTVPAIQVNDLQLCADFWEYAQSHENPLQWKNSPYKIAFEECRSRLIAWEPKIQKEINWKESALDRYTVIEARIVLRHSEQSLKITSTSKSKLT